MHVFLLPPVMCKFINSQILLSNFLNSINLVDIDFIYRLKWTFRLKLKTELSSLNWLNFLIMQQLLKTTLNLVVKSYFF